MPRGNEQDRARAIARRLTASNMNFKAALVEMLVPALPRHRRRRRDRPRRRTAHAGIGTAMLLTPELPGPCIRAITGFTWSKTPGRNDSWLLNDFYYPYGGINSDTIVRAPPTRAG